jgi:NAD(P)-dependent dehydrogenase (short-subunit alcohol dehydrogenase family)
MKSQIIVLSTEMDSRLDDIYGCNTRPKIAINPQASKEISMTSNSLPAHELDTRLRDRVAVVTGAARGIGRASAVAFARAGADLVGLDICAPVDPRSGVEPANPDDLAETGRLIEATGRRWLGVVLDQRDLAALRAFAVEVQRQFGGIDILFANAGIQSFHPLLEMQDADWNITIDVNLTGTANALRAFAPYIVKRGADASS